MVKALAAPRLVALFVGGWLLLNFPLLGLWDVHANVGGMPVFAAAIFVLWALLIAVLAWHMERVPPDAPAPEDQGSE